MQRSPGWAVGRGGDRKAKGLVNGGQCRWRGEDGTEDAGDRQTGLRDG